MTEQTQPTDALLPCPFCGAAAHFEMDEGRWEWVECESCGMQGNRSASLMDDCKPKLAEEWNRRTPPAVAPWRSAVLDLIDDCPGLTLEQDHWLSRRVKELDFATTPQPTQAQAGAVPLTEARHLFDAGWKAAARFCDREDVVADGIIGFGACPQFEAAFTEAHGVADMKGENS